MSRPSSMRLGYLVSRYPAVSHTFILREVQQLRRSGWAIEVASVNPVDRPSDDLTAEERSEAQSTFCLKRAGLRGAFKSQVRMLLKHPVGVGRAALCALFLSGLNLRQAVLNCCYFVEAVMVADWIEAHSLKHLHVHFATQAATVGLLAAKVAPVTFSITVHGPDEFYDVAHYRLREKISAAALLCAISCYARSQLMKLARVSEWDKIALTPLGVDPERFLPAWSRASETPREQDALGVLCVGRLVAAKGQHVLLAALDRLLAAGQRVHLTLVGDGPDRDALERTVKERSLSANVEFTGALNQDRVYEFYTRADVFALASFAEGVPVVLMEAMAMGIPCVSTWVAGIPELIRDGVDGLLVPPSDDAALAAALSQLIEDPSLRRRLAAAGRSRVIDKYHLQKNVSHLGRVFEQYLEAAA